MYISHLETYCGEPTYSAVDALVTTERVKIVDPKGFCQDILDPEIESYVVLTIAVTTNPIYTKRQARLAAVEDEELKEVVIPPGYARMSSPIKKPMNLHPILGMTIAFLPMMESNLPSALSTGSAKSS